MCGTRPPTRSSAWATGSSALLRDQLTDGDAPLSRRLEIPAVLARIGSQAAANALEENLLESEPELRFRTICALNDLRKEHPGTAIDPVRLRAALGFETMLHCRTNQILSVAGPREGPPARCRAGRRRSMRRLEASHDQEIERIFRLLSLLYPDTDFRSAHYGLRSSDATARDHAIEFLELALDRDLRKTLVSLLDPTAPLDERVVPILQRTGRRRRRPPASWWSRWSRATTPGSRPAESPQSALSA